MRGRGILFTVGVAAVGSVLLAGCISLGFWARPNPGDNVVVELVRASSHCTNLADQALEIFHESSGVEVSQGNGSFTLTDRLGAGRSEYQGRVGALRLAASLINSTVTLPQAPEIASGLGVDYIRLSERSSSLELPNETMSLVFRGLTSRDVSNCSLRFAPGDVRFEAEAMGSGSCRKAARVNLESPLGFWVNDEPVIMGEKMRFVLSAPAADSLNYSISILVNRTSNGGVILRGGASCVTGDASKEVGFELT